MLIKRYIPPPPVTRGSIVSNVVMRKIMRDKTASGWESSQLYDSEPYSSGVTV